MPSTRHRLPPLRPHERALRHRPIRPSLRKTAPRTPRTNHRTRKEPPRTEHGMGSRHGVGLRTAAGASLHELHRLGDRRTLGRRRRRARLLPPPNLLQYRRGILQPLPHDRHGQQDTPPHGRDRPAARKGTRPDGAGSLHHRALRTPRTRHRPLDRLLPRRCGRGWWGLHPVRDADRGVRRPRSRYGNASLRLPRSVPSSRRRIDPPRHRRKILGCRSGRIVPLQLLLDAQRVEERHAWQPRRPRGTQQTR